MEQQHGILGNSARTQQGPPHTCHFRAQRARKIAPAVGSNAPTFFSLVSSHPADLLLQWSVDDNDNDNDNDTLREVPHPSNEGMALQARV